MSRPTGNDWSFDRIQAMMAAPGAHSWELDKFQIFLNLIPRLYLMERKNAPLSDHPNQ